MRAPLPSLLTLAFLHGCTCSSPPELELTVTDPWGQPVPDVSVAFEGAEEPFTTDRRGRVSLPMFSPAELSLSREGSIPTQVTVTPDDTGTTFSQTLELLPEPPAPGFHLIGPSSYLTLQAQPVVRIGSDMNAWQGTRTAGDTVLPAGPMRLVFHTPMKLEQIARLQIELHRLTYIEEQRMGTVDGEAGVRVNLWVSDGQVDLARTPLGSPRNYLYLIDDLPRGTYALSTLALLDAKQPDAYDKAPPQVRTVHPFTVE